MLLLAALCYWPALHGKFVWDDENLVANNPYIRSPILIGEMFRHWLQPGSNSPYYRPVQTVSFALDYYGWGVNPLGYHLINVALHAASAGLLFLLLRRLLRGANPAEKSHHVVALVIATIWLIHPIHNAAVAYVSGRADSLGFLFACAAWLALLRAREASTYRAAGYLGAAVLMMLALCSKEISAVWLGIFSAHTLCARDLSWKSKLARLVGCLVLLWAWLMMRQLPVEPSLPAQSVFTTLPQRVVLTTRAIADYACLIVFPGELHMERSLWPEWFAAKTNWSNVAWHMGWTGWTGVLVVALVSLGCIARGAGRYLRIGGAVWFVFAFLPISNAFPLNAQAAEHWIYLASVGALCFLAGAFLLLPARLRKAGGIILLIWGCGLVVRTHLRAAEWRDPVVLYSQTIGSMGGTPRMFNNLATTLQRRGRLEQAERVYELAVKRYPTATLLLYNYGTLLQKKGSKTEAEALFERARAIATERQGPKDGLANIKAIAGQARAALEDGHPERVLEILSSAETSNDAPWELVRLRCQALVELKRLDEAREWVQKEIQKTWWNQDARSLLARMLERTGDFQQSEREWRQAARLDVWDPEPWVALSRISQRKGDHFAAIRYQGEAVERTPKNVEVRFVLAALLREAGRHEEASEELLKARYLQAGGEL